jgi:hypothetical protein
MLYLQKGFLYFVEKKLSSLSSWRSVVNPRAESAVTQSTPVGVLLAPPRTIYVSFHRTLYSQVVMASVQNLYLKVEYGVHVSCTYFVVFAVVFPLYW